MTNEIKHICIINRVLFIGIIIFIFCKEMCLNQKRYYIFCIIVIIIMTLTTSFFTSCCFWSRDAFNPELVTQHITTTTQIYVYHQELLSLTWTKDEVIIVEWFRSTVVVHSWENLSLGFCVREKISLYFVSVSVFWTQKLIKFRFTCFSFKVKIRITYSIMDIIFQKTLR